MESGVLVSNSLSNFTTKFPWKATKQISMNVQSSIFWVDFCQQSTSTGKQLCTVGLDNRLDVVEAQLRSQEVDELAKDLLLRANTRETGAYPEPSDVANEPVLLHW